jgi:2,3-bisphosphoglycerate-independent phosphoglycerate mutase
MKLLFLFLDGVGLGDDDPSYNPLARTQMPNLEAILEGKRMLADHAPAETRRATLLPLDAGLGVKGLPQSATGQAALLTGENVPAALGYHYGPKPNRAVAQFLRNGNLFSRLMQIGLKVSFLNAYPPGYFAGIDSGRRLYSAIPLAATHSGLKLKSTEDLVEGQAISADFTGQGWRDHLGILDAPLLEPYQAGMRLADLTQQVDFAFFEYWLSDYAGHGQDMEKAVTILKSLDQVLGGLFATWKDKEGIIFITSDHGNLEDLRTRRHTGNPVPALVVGEAELRTRFSAGLENLTDAASAILNLFNPSPIAPSFPGSSPSPSQK